MLDYVSDEARLVISSAYRIAYSGSVDNALQQLRTILDSSNSSNIDRSIISITIAELFFLDGRFEDSREVIDRDISPIVGDLPDDIRIPILANRADLASRLFEFEQIISFYKLSDEMKIAGIQLSDSQELLRATQQAAQGRSYNSLPAIWRELTRTYKQRVWSEFRNASEFMAEECIRIGELSQAAYHACIACSSDLAKRVAEVMVNGGSTEQISDTVDKLIGTTNLYLHAAVACELLGGIADVVPDHQVQKLVKWILEFCKLRRSSEHNSLGCNAWRALSKFGNRLEEFVADEVLKVAIESTTWNAPLENLNKVPILRKAMVNSVNNVLPSVSQAQFEQLAEKALPLVTVRRHFHDFESVVNLLAHAVHLHDNEEFRLSIRSSLYPAGEQIPPALLQLAEHFGQNISNEDGQLDRYVDSLIEILQKTVQRVPKGTSAEKVGGTIMTHTSNIGDETIHVHNISTDSIHSIIRNKDRLSPESISKLIRALLICIADENNSPENRLAFTECIRGFAEHMEREVAEEVGKMLQPIINHDIDPEKFSPENHHPLDSFRYNGTTFQQFVGLALFVLAKIERYNSGANAKFLIPAIEESLSSIWPVIRKSAYAAVRELPTVSERLWMPLLLGTRDHNPESASLAFDAISNKKDSGLKRPHWPILLHSMRLASQNSSINLRRAAALATRKLSQVAPNPKVKAELSALNEAFSADISCSVRDAAAGK